MHRSRAEGARFGKTVCALSAKNRILSSQGSDTPVSRIRLHRNRRMNFITPILKFNSLAKLIHIGIVRYSGLHTLAYFTDNYPALSVRGTQRIG